MIKNSVGRKGVNTKADVLLIQEALNRSISIPRRLLKVDGIAGLLTIGEIERFQKNAAGFSKPDGLIEANGKTWQKLSRYLTESPTHKIQDLQIFADTRKTGTPAITPKDQPRKIAWGKRSQEHLKIKSFKSAATSMFRQITLWHAWHLKPEQPLAPALKMPLAAVQ